MVEVAAAISGRQGRHPLDSPVWSSLVGLHAVFAERVGGAVRYRPEVAPFTALAPDARDGGNRWADLLTLVGPGQVVALPGPLPARPAGWEITARIPGVQLVATGALHAAPDPEAVPLGPADVPEMLSLVARTEPGPFQTRTYQLGGYLGIRRGGALIAMAGQRLHPPGWTEISAVCTDPAYRGQGLAGRLVRAVAYGIRARGETPFLHAAATNTAAIRLYESLGFRHRRHIDFHAVRTPVARPR